MKLLIADDDISMLDILKDQLKTLTHLIVTVTTTEKARECLQSSYFDAFICDYHFQDQKNNGLELIRYLRKIGENIPVLMLTSEVRSKNSIEVLNSGADEYIIKPYMKEELIARLKALLRRTSKSSVCIQNYLSHNGFQLDRLNKRINIDKKWTQLSNIQFLILEKLFEYKGNVVTYEFLIEYIWGESALFSDYSIKTLRVHMAHIKNMLSATFTSQIITVAGTGYKLETIDEI